MKVTLFEVIDVIEEAWQTLGPGSHCANVEISENKTYVCNSPSEIEMIIDMYLKDWRMKII